jgi:hypothetical protein
MRKSSKSLAVAALAVAALVAMLAGCAGGRGTVSYGVHYGYHDYYGPRPWGGYRDTVIVVPPDTGDDLVATPLPEPPPDIPDIPDMGMPDMDFGGFD